MRRALKLLFIGVAACGLAMSPVAAKVTKPTPPPTPPACQSTDISVASVACTGFYAGNINGGSPAKLAEVQSALDAFAGYKGKISNLGTILTVSGNTINFASPFTGVAFVGLHFGNGTDGPTHVVTGGVTGFYEINANNLTSFTTHWGDLSNAVLYRSAVPVGGVPEPATWAMMLLGFGVVGAGLRRRGHDTQMQVA